MSRVSVRGRRSLGRVDLVRRPGRGAPEACLLLAVTLDCLRRQPLGGGRPLTCRRSYAGA
jgi:hypothetical protein